MNFIIISIFVTLAVLIAAFIGYTYTTNSIIRDQEKEIAKLRTENYRLQAALHNRQRVQVVEIHDHSIDEQNIPEFNNI